uniref:Uncharacterized protein n=1 Tax=Brassica campestris TaxID=3711 RepID=A0A3P5ZG23_BRACM|nr:unnamed protein product [Brassica rapa]
MQNTLIQEGKEMASILYTYRSCVKALPQGSLPESMKHSQADLWQSLASAKLAADMQRSSRPERRINGPTVTHLWSMLKLLDILVQLDHLKNAKASIPNYFSWYKR